MHNENVTKGVALLRPIHSQTHLFQGGVYLEDNFRWCGLLLNSNSIVHQRFGDEKCIVSTSVFHNSSIIESLMLATDNATVVVYLINQGGTHCHVLFLLCKEIQRLCLQHYFHLEVKHTQGTFNVCLGPFDYSIILLWDHPLLNHFK